MHGCLSRRVSPPEAIKDCANFAFLHAIFAKGASISTQIFFGDQRIGHKEYSKQKKSVDIEAPFPQQHPELSA